MYTRHTHNNAIIQFWLHPDTVEAEAMKQIHNISTLPFIYKHVAIMPDVHAGIGATIGSVIPTVGAVIPAAVGVDIGCGMCAVPTHYHANQLPDSLKALRLAMESVVPVGFESHPDNTQHLLPQEQAAMAWETPIQSLLSEYNVTSGKQNPFQQLGTLGGGNHFIELCLDETNHVWLMLHSGSRGIGNRIGNRFIEVAQTELEKRGEQLQDPNLAYLKENTSHFEAYIQAVSWAQQYAALNRRVMLRRLIEVLTQHLPGFTLDLVDLGNRVVQCHHNYISREIHFGQEVILTRKGAVRAQKGELGIIPGSMGAKSYIVEGLGNEASFHSCSHGAGRQMSRTKAKKRFSLADHAAATQGIECRKDAGVLDETPMAYKDIDEVMANQTDLVRPLHTLRQIICIKG